MSIGFYEELPSIEHDLFSLKGIRLYSTKVNLVPSWVMEGLSTNPYFILR